MSEQVIIPDMTVYDDVEAGMDLETEGGQLPPDAAGWRFIPATSDVVPLEKYGGLLGHCPACAGSGLARSGASNFSRCERCGGAGLLETEAGLKRAASTASGRHAALLHAAEGLLEKFGRSDFFDIDFGVGLERSDELAALREAVAKARAAAQAGGAP